MAEPTFSVEVIGEGGHYSGKTDLSADEAVKFLADEMSANNAERKLRLVRRAPGEGATVVEIERRNGKWDFKVSYYE